VYDAIILGARCAGAATAMLLARKGHKVLLLDRSTFPSDIPHGHLIHRSGPMWLARWGLLERIHATGCPAIDSIVSDYGDFPLIGQGLSLNGVAMACAPRRFSLDKVLVDAAVEAGAELREGFAVNDFQSQNGRIIGVCGRSREDGSTLREAATVTVGADGRRSSLARMVAAAEYQSVPTLTCWYFSYWGGVADQRLHVHVRQNFAIFAFPTTDGLFGVMIAWPIAEFPAVRSDIEGRFMAAVDEVPELSQRLRAGRREERFSGAIDLPNFFRKPFGPGWALVGDAGCHKDPFLALGICDAFRDAELLADALHEGLSGRRTLEGALADYERRRNESSMPDYQQNIALARFQRLPPELARIRAAVRGNQEATNHFFMAFEGMRPPESFFNPENLGRLMGGRWGGKSQGSSHASEC
jgi:flavin-dependent dehydrogenase